MDIVLGILRYLFVATTLVGGGLVLMAIVRLAREKAVIHQQVMNYDGSPDARV